MHRKPDIVLGQTDPTALNDPEAARYLSEEFAEEFLRGFNEAKQKALERRERATKPVKVAA